MDEKEALLQQWLAEKDAAEAELRAEPEEDFR